MKDTNKLGIVCLSNQFYDLPLKTNKYLVMNELARVGHKVVFVDPPTRFKFVKQLLKKKKISFLERKSSNLIVYSPVNFFNFAPFSYLNNLVHYYFIRKALRSLKAKEDVLWVYHFDFPKIFFLKKLLNPKVFIYDIVDNYEAFPEYAQQDTTNTGLVKYIQKADYFLKRFLDQKGLYGVSWVRYQEDKLSNEANLIFTSHPYLYKKFSKYGKKVKYTPNAGSFKKALEARDIKLSYMSHLKKPLVGYSGAIDSYKFDVDTFIYGAKSLPNVHFVLMGPLKLSDSSTKVEELHKLKNVTLLGPKKYEESLAFLYYLSAYIIPYNLNDYTVKGCFPVKFFNALAIGVPTVVSNLPAYKGFEDVLYIYKNKEEYVTLLKKALKEDSKELRKSRINISQKNTWENKAKTQTGYILSILN